jgi:hypothetical protein
MWAVGGGTLLDRSWTVETFIANSTSQNSGIGMDLRAANSWPLRSPGILSRRAPCRFLLPRRQLLDQPSKPMRNPSHQLNAGDGAKDMPDWGIDGPIAISLTASLRRHRDDLAKHLGIARESRPRSTTCSPENAKSTSYYGPTPQSASASIFPALPYLRHAAQIVSACPMPTIHPFKRRPSWPSRRRNSQPQCAASSQ